MQEPTVAPVDAEYYRKNAYGRVEECCQRNKMIAHTSYNVSIFMKPEGSISAVFTGTRH